MESVYFSFVVCVFISGSFRSMDSVTEMPSLILISEKNVLTV